MQSLPKNYVQGDDSRILRDVFGCFATGITIVTFVSEFGISEIDTSIIENSDFKNKKIKMHGMTANSFSSVSLDPPLVSICIGINSGNYKILRDCSHFAINILNDTQKQIANIFGKPRAKGTPCDKFSYGEWLQSECGAPILADALANIECKNFKAIEAGDHVILLGEIERAKFNRDKTPLLYHRSQYSKLQKLD